MRAGDVVTLARDCRTPWGVYTAGLDVTVLALGPGRLVRVCLDVGHHPATSFCHTRLLDGSWFADGGNNS